MAGAAAVVAETRSTKGAATRDQILNAAARLMTGLTLREVL